MHSLRCYIRHLFLLPSVQGNWAESQGKDIYVRNYYSTKAFFDKLPGQQGQGR